MLFRLFVAFVVLVAVLALLRQLRRVGGRAERRAIDATTVRCAHCAVYVPSGEAVVRGGISYCSAAHADAGQR